MTTIQLKMENTYNPCNVIKIVLQRKITKTKRRGPFSLLKFHMALTQSCKNISTYLFKHPNTLIAKGRK